ncbi:hypothetical protein [Cellulomonas soli]|uniref:hypothetical protein n=1 Tax=Cellulomonas soli TaxID=931535 RepID=UPI0011BDA6CB|nr:hypothetical protein [Cellulomonas soli]NYI60110.1 hypothetical protein [Cellulomonas soli]
MALGAACAPSPPPSADSPSSSASTSPPTALQASLTSVQATTAVATTDDDAAALAVSQALFEAAPVVVLAASGDQAGQLTAASVAVAVGAPVLVVAGSVADADVARELERLGTTHVLEVGDAATRTPQGTSVTWSLALPASADADLLEQVTGRPFVDGDPVAEGAAATRVDALVQPRTTALVAAGVAPEESSADVDAPRPTPSTATTPTPAAQVTGPVLVPRASPSTSTSAPGADPDAAATPTSGSATLPRTDPPEPLPDALLLTLPGSTAVAAHATARAAGLTVLQVPGGDPRADEQVVDALAAAAPTTVLTLGAQFGDQATADARVAAAVTGAQLPGGGQLVFTDGAHARRYVALYGTPGTPALGVLGEQDVPATIARAQEHAGWYDALTDDTVVPMVEIIATIASAGPGPDGNYSDERSVDDLRPLVEAAGEAGVSVVLDLQPGRTDFLTQAKQYEELLALPHVGLALDPEWRLAADQVHLRQIGSVGVDEINATAAWLAQLTRERHLPQKMFVVHQFSTRMVSDRTRLDVSHDELAVLIHVDGQGTQPAKTGTWNALRADAPAVHWGWKNFYDEDLPMLDPTQTYQVQPVPDLVTYQ